LKAESILRALVELQINSFNECSGAAIAVPISNFVMMYFSNLFFTSAKVCSLVMICCCQQVKAGEVAPFVDWLLEDEERMEDVRFAEVVTAVSGKRVLAMDLAEAGDAELLDEIERALEAMFGAFSEADHPIHQVGRVNEVSRYLEEFLLARLDSVEGLSCQIPANASGELQRSGYPDLRLSHDASGRVFYLDPKVYKAGSETSSFRTFYFEPKRRTNKILDDASHLIVGISHLGKVDGTWQFDAWKLVDLIDFRVRLKAEFQASNRELYKDASVILQSDTVILKRKSSP
jgi:hypothetical protein